MSSEETAVDGAGNRAKRKSTDDEVRYPLRTAKGNSSLFGTCSRKTGRNREAHSPTN